MINRVRQIIPHITKEEWKTCFSEDLYDLIPNISCDYPSFIHNKKIYSDFGFYMEYLVKKMLSKIVPTNFQVDPICLNRGHIPDVVTKWNKYVSNDTKWEEIVYDIRDLLQINNLTNSELDHFYSFFQNLYTYLYHYFKTSTHLTFTFNTEVIHQNVSGHPDAECDNSVIEIKNTSNPSKDKLNHLKQTFAYIALKRVNNIKCDFITFIFPMQINVTIIDVRNWNHEFYLKLLLQKSTQLSSSINIVPSVMKSEFDLSSSASTNIIPFNSLDLSSLKDVLFIILDDNKMKFQYQIELSNYGIGTHIKKEDTILQSLSNAYKNCGNVPFQIYLRNPRFGKANVNMNDIINSRIIIDKLNLKVFVHCALCVNLAHPFTKKNPSSDEWPIGIMIEDLKNCNAFNGKGLVIHCGTHTHDPVDIALNKFETSIRKILLHATVNCPLILETCAGEDKDLCHQFPDLVNFYNRFSSEERTRLKICVDTCHVFAAGYTPSLFITNWELIFPDSIRLVHFNDSKKPFNCRVDRHEYYITDNPQIGEDLLEVAKYCISHNIPMVTE